VANFGGLYRAHALGEAYLEARRSQEAAAEFQIPDHRGIVFADPIGAFARSELGTAFALSGDTAKVKAE